MSNSRPRAFPFEPFPGLRSTDIAAVGPVSNHVAGAQNVIHYLSQDMEEAGDLNAFAQRLFERNRGQAIDTRLLVGFCLLVRREVVDTIGGFDEQTGCSNFEDDDFCIRANLADIRGTIARDCFVHQFGGRTFGRLGIPYCRQLDANWQGFREKWNISGGPGLDGTYMLAKTRGGFDPAKHYIAVGT